MDFILEHMGTIITVAIFVFAKLVPNDKLFGLFRGLGSFLTLKMNKYKWWQKVEDWLIDGISVAIEGFFEGLRHDNRMV